MVLALGCALACTPYATLKNVSASCSVEGAYELENVDSQFSMTWIANDSTPGSIMSAGSETIPGGAPCGDTAALVARANHNNDWGSLFGFYAFGKNDESDREGLSFWARAPGNTGKGFTILLDDLNTYDPYVSCMADAGMVLPPGDAGAFCTTYCTVDGGAAGTAPTYGPDGTLLSSGTLAPPPPPNACGNQYQSVVLVTADWQFYTIPFNQFQQQPKPNMVPNSVFRETGSAYGTQLLTSAIVNMTFRFPKESPVELWIDHLGFYRHKGWAPPGRGGGVDGQ